MDYQTLQKRIQDTGILPEIPASGDGARIASSLDKACLPAALIDFRGEDRSETVRIMRMNCRGMLIGAFTGEDPSAASLAAAAGCDFVLADGVNEECLALCREKGIAVIPGCASKSDADRAKSLGLPLVALKNENQDYQEIIDLTSNGKSKFCARIDQKIAAVDWTKEGAYDEIAANAEAALLREIGFKPYHLGMNSRDRDDALTKAKTLSSLFGVPMIETRRSFLIGDLAEVMMLPYLGYHGHMGVHTNNLRLAMAYLKRKGVELNMATYEENADGEPVIVYLNEEVGGFAIHLTQAPR